MAQYGLDDGFPLDDDLFEEEESDADESEDRFDLEPTIEQLLGTRYFRPEAEDQDY